MAKGPSITQSGDKIEIETSLDDLLNVVSNRMLFALSAFYIWKWISQAINVNNAGGKEAAEKNVAILNTYRNFFVQVIISTYKSFVADLAIFFDAGKYPENLCLGKLLDKLKEKVMGSEIDEVKQQITEIKRKHGITIDLLLKLRNADVSHQEIKPQQRKIIYSELEGLFSAVQEILNLISGKYNRSFTFWDHIEQGISRHMQWLIDNLERGEKLRLEEIDRKYKVR